MNYVLGETAQLNRFGDSLSWITKKQALDRMKELYPAHHGLQKAVVDMQKSTSDEPRYAV